MASQETNKHQLAAAEKRYLLDHYKALHIDSDPIFPKLTGIICTIGPASQEVTKLVEMLKAGMNVIRVNFSHGTYEYHENTMKNAKEAMKKFAEEKGYDSYPVAIALDTKGPEIRTGLIEKGENAEVELVKGKSVKVTTDEAFFKKCTEDLIYVDYKNITKVMKEDSRMYIDDGQLCLIAKSIGSDSMECVVESGGMLGSEKGCNLPGVETDLPATSERDKEDLLFGVEKEVDMVFASFIRNAAGVKEIRNILGEKGKRILILPKIECYEGVKKIDEIIEASDGIMVARGDLGIEIPTEKIFLVTKSLIAKCNSLGKPVICATQMLQSMQEKPRPTRAEDSDVANAVLDGADCVMLSGESAKGEYPVEAVKIMHAICREAEAAFYHKNKFSDLIMETPVPTDKTTAIGIAAVVAAMKHRACAIIVLTVTGRTAHVISKYRPRCPIIAVTRCALTANQAVLYRGIKPVLFKTEKLPEWEEDKDKQIKYAVECGKKMEIFKSGDTVVIVSGSGHGPDTTSAICFYTIE